MQKIPKERARELYNQERDKVITTTEYIAEIVKECFPGLVVRCTNSIGGGSIYVSGPVLKSMDKVEIQKLIDCFYSSNYHFPFPSQNDLNFEVRATRYQAGPNQSLYLGT